MQNKFIVIFFEISREKEGMPENIAFFEVTDRVDDDPDELYKTRWGMDLHFAMRVADYPALDVWKEKLVEKGVPVEGPIDHATAAESAQTRENLRKWNAWKASRMQTAAE